MTELLFVTAASLLAGLIDAIVGGGGLILTPALFAAYPAAPAATMLGTNKSASIWGSSLAAWQYGRQIAFRWPVAAPALAACLVGSALGTITLLFVSSQWLRKALPFVLLAVLLYTLFNKTLGQAHAPRYKGSREVCAACLIGCLIGFYDGFFGPGTGSFFVFAFVRIMGYDFLSASAHAKLLNVATNFAALVLFAYKGHIWWEITIYLVVANLVGSFAGTRLAMRHGSGFVRRVFVCVVTLLIAKTGYDAFFRN